MLGLLSAGRSSAFTTKLVGTAWDMAKAMMEERNQRKEQSVNERSN